MAETPEQAEYRQAQEEVAAAEAEAHKHLAAAEWEVTKARHLLRELQEGD
jgi:hypothetical protein